MITFCRFASACGRLMSTRSFSITERSNGSSESSMRPDSIFDTSKISLIRDNRCLPEEAIFERQSFTRFVSSMLAPAIAVMPMIALSGVRMSWLMFERKLVLAARALAAASSAVWSASRAAAWCLLAYFCDNIFIQIGVFLLTSIIVLVCTKPLSQKIRKGKKVATNSDRVIGMEGVVTMDISKNNVGEVKVDGKRWSAVSKEELHKDDVVVIKKIDGVKLIVEKER